MDDSLPNLAPSVEIGATSNAAAAVIAIVRLLKEVDSRYFSAMSPEGYSLFTSARAILDYKVERWVVASERERGIRGGESIRKEEVLGDRNPLEVVHTLLRALPELAPQGASTDLTFVSDADLAESIRADKRNALSAHGNGEFKACCVMAGAAIEAMLLWAIREERQNNPKAKSKKPPKAQSSDPLDWKLWQLLHNAKEVSLIDEKKNTNPIIDYAYQVWGALSRACHHHSYELAPTAGELEGWITWVAQFQQDEPTLP